MVESSRRKAKNRHANLSQELLAEINIHSLVGSGFSQVSLHLSLCFKTVDRFMILRIDGYDKQYVFQDSHNGF
jgi:hypothetical protein